MRQSIFDVPYRFDDYLKDLKYLQENYPDYVTLFTMGKSEDGREIFLLRVGNGPIPIVITAGVHGRETINPMVIVRIIENYLELATNTENSVTDFFMNEGQVDLSNQSDPYLRSSILTITDMSLGPSNVRENGMSTEFESEKKSTNIPIEYDLRSFLNEYTLYVIPLLNPDGYEIALGGFQTIQNPRLREMAKQMGIPYEEWKANARGVDINRNFPSVSWKDKFPGDLPASENETKALIDLFAQVPAAGYLDLHSRGKAIYYHKAAMSDAYNARQKKIAESLQKVTGYDLMSPEDEIESNDSGGNTVHYFSEKYHKPAITIETVKDMAAFPLDIRYQRPTFEEIYLVPMEFAYALINS